MRFTDREKILEIEMRTFDGTSHGQDFSGEFFSSPNLTYNEYRDAYLVDDVDYLVEQAKDWKAGRGDFFECGAGENDDYFITVYEDVFKYDADYDTMAASLYDGGWRAEDRDDIKDEYDLTDEQTEKICERLAEYAK